MNENPDDVVDDNEPDSVVVPSDEELDAMLRQEGIEMGEQDFADLRDTASDMVRERSPQLAAYLEEMTPRLDEVLRLASEKKIDGDERGSVEALVAFVEEEMKKLESVDPGLREQALFVLGGAVSFQQLSEDLKKYAKADVASSAVDLIPVIGSAKMLGEAARGKTASGSKLEGGGRVWHAAMGTTFLVLDVAGLGTAGTTTAASEAGKVARAAEKGAEVAMLTTKLARIAGLLAKSSRFAKASSAVSKFADLVTKYPKLSHALLKIYSWRKQAKMAYRYEDKVMRARELAELHEAVEGNSRS